MNKYEAMIIFPESMKEEDLETGLEKIGTEIEKLGGTVVNKTRLGRRTFARPMQKHTAGQYAVVGFSLAGDKLGSLQGRFRLNEEIFRVQIVRVEEAPVAAK